MKLEIKELFKEISKEAKQETKQETKTEDKVENLDNEETIEIFDYDLEILTKVNRALKNKIERKKKIGLKNIVYTSLKFISNKETGFYELYYITPSSIEEYQTKYLVLDDIKKTEIRAYRKNLEVYSDFNIKRKN